jgi:hypothetical protein
MKRVYEDIPENALSVAGRVLVLVTSRAEEELAS